MLVTIQYNPLTASYNQRRAYERLINWVGTRNNAEKVRATGNNWPFLVLDCRPGSPCRVVTVRTFKQDGRMGCLVYEGSNRNQGQVPTHKAWSDLELDNILEALGVPDQAE